MDLFALLLALPFLADDEDKWIVDAPHGPETTLKGEFSAGTWVIVDVSPDGKHIAFDHRLQFAGAGAYVTFPGFIAAIVEAMLHSRVLILVVVWQGRYDEIPANTGMTLVL